MNSPNMPADRVKAETLRECIAIVDASENRVDAMDRLEMLLHSVEIQARRQLRPAVSTRRQAIDRGQ